MIKQLNDNLTKDQEIELGRKVQAGLDAKEKLKGANLSDSEIETLMAISHEGDMAHEQLVGNYINLARQIAHKHHSRTGTQYSIEDLIQDAILALCEAAYTFDPEKNCKLGTHAFYGISKKVSTTINSMRLVRLPENKMGEYLQILRAEKAWADMPADEQVQDKTDFIAEFTGLSRTEIELINSIMLSSVSLNTTVNENNGELIDLMGAEETYESENYRYEDLDPSLVEILRKLTPMERDLVAYEFDTFPASMEYSDFLVKYNWTDKDINRETRKVIRKMRKIAEGVE